jgi:hypothetical protein
MRSIIVSFPDNVLNAYKVIKNSTLITNNLLTDESIKEFQDTLNQAQPINDIDKTMFETFRLLYRSTIEFDRFIVKNKIKHLILWTESKSIVRHFNLYGLVYVKWNTDTNMYNCSLHKNSQETLERLKFNKLNNITYNRYNNTTNPTFNNTHNTHRSESNNSDQNIKPDDPNYGFKQQNSNRRYSRR